MAVFCPHCGCCVNESDLDLQDDEVEEPVATGGAYTCGWCQVRTTDWNHVKRCRAAAKIRETFERRVLRIEHVADLMALQEELKYD